MRVAFWLFVAASVSAVGMMFYPPDGIWSVVFTLVVCALFALVMGGWQTFVLRSTFDAVRRENMTLREALRDANAELHKHRRLIADIRDGDPRVMGLIMIPKKEQAKS